MITSNKRLVFQRPFVNLLEFAGGSCAFTSSIKASMSPRFLPSICIFGCTHMRSISIRSARNHKVLSPVHDW